MAADLEVPDGPCSRRPPLELVGLGPATGSATDPSAGPVRRSLGARAHSVRRRARVAVAGVAAAPRVYGDVVSRMTLGGVQHERQAIAGAVGGVLALFSVSSAACPPTTATPRVSRRTASTPTPTTDEPLSRSGLTLATSMQLIVPARNEEARLPRTLDCCPRPRGREGHRARSRSSSSTTPAPTAPPGGPGGRHARRCRSGSIAVRHPGQGGRGAGGDRSHHGRRRRFMDADGATHLDALRRRALLAAGPTWRSAPGRCRLRHHTSDTARCGLGAALYRRCTRTIAPGIPDTQCGFKLLRGDLAREVFAQTTRRRVLLRRRGAGPRQRARRSVVEFPVAWDDVPGSTFDPFWHGLPRVLGARGDRASCGRSGRVRRCSRLLPRRAAPHSTAVVEA